MIYTVTFNPSLDYAVCVENFQLGAVNRTVSEKLLPGGKGINVSIVLKNLGVDSTVLGFIAGFTGDKIEYEVKRHDCETDFIRVEKGFSRINVKLKAGQETELNGQGPKIGEADLEKLFQKLKKIQNGDILVLAGSIPNSLPTNIYERIMTEIQQKQIKVVVDATRDLLLNVLGYHPFLIKPNHHELGEIFGRELKSRDEVILCAKQLQQKGARNVLASMAGDGAVLVAENGAVFSSPAPQGKVRNSVGAGDSMVAGFLAGYLAGGDYRYAFQMGIAAGSASAFSEELARKDEVVALMNHISV